MMERVKQILDEELKHAQEIYDNLYCEGLKINTIEAEGYLRAVKRIRNMVYDEINRLSETIIYYD